MPRNPVKIANQSGFPLQIAAADEIGRLRSLHGWEVLQTEHAWANRNDGRSGFVDLLVVNRMGTNVLVVECKRQIDSAWVFLCESPRQLRRRQCKSWVVATVDKSVQHIGWKDVAVDPHSPQSAYCAVAGQSDDAPMLERIAGTLVSATEAIATERRLGLARPDLVTYFNVILTTASLHVVMFNPESISLRDGKLPEATDTTEYPFVRFRKQLSAVHDVDVASQPASDRQLAEARENTVFVVKAEQLRAFLSQFEVDVPPVARYR